MNDITVNMLAKITMERVQDIKIGELIDIVPAATHDELTDLKNAIKNIIGEETEKQHNRIGEIIMMLIYRKMQRKILETLK